MIKKPPIIDWNYATKLAGGKEELAREMIAMLEETLPSDVASIRMAFEKNDLTAMQASVHRLHGAVSYCGIPVLKQLLAELELALKNNLATTIPTLFAKLELVVAQLLAEIHEQP